MKDPTNATVTKVVVNINSQRPQSKKWMTQPNPLQNQKLFHENRLYAQIRALEKESRINDAKLDMNQGTTIEEMNRLMNNHQSVDHSNNLSQLALKKRFGLGQKARVTLADLTQINQN